MAQSFQAHSTAAKRFCDQFVTDLFYKNVEQTNICLKIMETHKSIIKNVISGSAIKANVGLMTFENK